MANLTNAKGKVVKGVNGKPVQRSGYGRGAASNWDAFGTEVKTKGLKLEDGVYQVKGGVLKRMADTNGTGTVCVVYRVAAKTKVEAPAKKSVAKAAPAKKGNGAKKEAPKATKKETKKVDKAKKGNAKRGK